MMLYHRVLLLVWLAALGLGSSARAGLPEAAPPPPADDRLRTLEAENRDLQRQLADIRQRLGLPATSPAKSEPTANVTDILLGRDPQPPKAEPKSAGAKIDLKNGVRLSSADDRFRVEFHDLSQFEARITNPNGDPLHNTFNIPRQRFYFAGQIDTYFDFYTSLNRGYGTLDIFDSYVNFKFDPAFNLRVGRTKTPYSYEYYKIADGDLIAPERSLFVGNLAPNRQVGAMLYGRGLDERIEYAVGLFNGPHRSFQDFNNYKNPFLYVNTRPFLHGTNDVLRNLNLGASANYGRENDPLEPTALRTANDETTAAAIDSVAPAFLKFNPDAKEVGETAFWSGDVAWFYRRFTMLAMYNGGFMTYSQPKNPSTRVPFSGFSVAATYFLTGEEITSRKSVEPIRDFDLRDPFQSPGAIEAYSRISYLNAGSNVYTSGLVDPKLWSNDAAVTDVGVNWYVNRYVRIFLDWQHSHYGSPVQVGPGRLTKSSDLFWVRTQLYY